MAKGLDRVHHRGSLGWVKTEQDSDPHRDPKREGDRLRGDDRVLVRGEEPQDFWDADPDANPEDATNARKDDGLDQELLGDVAPLRSQSADESRSLGFAR